MSDTHETHECRYARELDELSELVQRHHPIGRFRAIGRLNVLPAVRYLLEPPSDPPVPAGCDLVSALLQRLQEIVDHHEKQRRAFDSDDDFGEDYDSARYHEDRRNIALAAIAMAKKYTP